MNVKLLSLAGIALVVLCGLVVVVKVSTPYESEISYRVVGWAAVKTSDGWELRSVYVEVSTKNGLSFAVKISDISGFSYLLETLEKGDLK